jgi:hypothetical protein
VTVQRQAAARPSTCEPERWQREWELTKAIEGLRGAQARVEIVGDRPLMVRYLRRFRDDLADELARLDQAGDVDADGAVDHSGLIPTIDERDGGRNDR